MKKFTKVRVENITYLKNQFEIVQYVINIKKVLMQKQHISRSTSASAFYRRQKKDRNEVKALDNGHKSLHVSLQQQYSIHFEDGHQHLKFPNVKINFIKNSFGNARRQRNGKLYHNIDAAPTVQLHYQQYLFC